MALTLWKCSHLPYILQQSCDNPYRLFVPRISSYLRSRSSRVIRNLEINTAAVEWISSNERFNRAPSSQLTSRVRTLGSWSWNRLPVTSHPATNSNSGLNMMSRDEKMNCNNYCTRLTGNTRCQWSRRTASGCSKEELYMVVNYIRKAAEAAIKWNL